ncbi:COG3011 Predicted thiol-disulfide oxidoreductase [actinobacterium SCGC AAA044-D11]
MTKIVVIYDGKCQLCKNSIYWIEKKLKIKALDFHTADLSKFNLSFEQCSREVFVLADAKIFSGAKAVAFLLRRRGNKFLSLLITLSGPLGRSGYKWVARNRSSAPVKLLSRLLKP